jgi:hypothetical protein
MKDLSILLENRPGALAEMGEALGRAGVSIEGGGAFVSQGVGVAHFLFSDTADRKTRSGPRNEALRRARVCYDHLAGEVGVRLLERMRKRQLLRGDDPFLELTAAGEKWAIELGIDLDGLRRKPRPLIRVCLDWSERRSHLSGGLGAAILERMFELRFATRDSLSRTVLLSPRGETFLASLGDDVGRPVVVTSLRG